MNLVVDASVLSELLLRSTVGAKAESIMKDYEGRLHVPELVIPEVVSVVRRLRRAETINIVEAEFILFSLGSFPAQRWPMDGLVPRAWELRDSMSAYDAMYVSLAEVLGADLLTMDQRLAQTVKSVARCSIVLINDREDLP